MTKGVENSTSPCDSKDTRTHGSIYSQGLQADRSLLIVLRIIHEASILMSPYLRTTLSTVRWGWTGPGSEGSVRVDEVNE